MKFHCFRNSVSNLHLARTGIVWPLLAWRTEAAILPDPPIEPNAPLTVPSRLNHLESSLSGLPKVVAVAVAGFSLQTTDREESRQFFNQLYQASENIPPAWTGSLTTGDPGTTSAAFRDAVALRVNYFRAMTGVPADIVFSDEFNRKAQQAALMMSANNQFNHAPPVTWKFYTAEGAEAAGKSNLTLGSTGPLAISSLMSDGNGNNAAVGHRRWILYPQTQIMGTGNIPATGSFKAAAALWIFDSNFAHVRPKTRDGFVAWPPPGFVPYQVVFPRWSFSYPGGNFTGTTVTLHRKGISVPVRSEIIADGYGENTLVWVPDNLDANASFYATQARPNADTTTTVTLNNVIIAGAARNFTYNVTVFDPQVTDSSSIPAGKLRFVSTQRLPSGLIQVGFVGDGGHAYTIQASTDLVTWKLLINTTGPIGIGQVIDPESASVPRRFYRAIKP